MRTAVTPLGLLFTGLSLLYIAGSVASFTIGVKIGADGQNRPTPANGPSA